MYFYLRTIQTELKDELKENDMTFEEYVETDKPFAKLVVRARSNLTHEVRKDGSEDEFEKMTDVFLRVCVPDIVWRRNHLNLPLSNFITYADEAFALLSLENNVDEWVDRLVKKNETTKKGTLTKWTGLKGKSNGNKNKKVKTRGWSTAGGRRYNKIYHAVKRLRKEQLSIKMERELMEKWKREDGATVSDEEVESDSDDESDVTVKKKFKPVSGFDDD